MAASRSERPLARAAGALWALTPTPITLGLYLHGPLRGSADAWVLVLELLSTGSLILGAATLIREPRIGRPFASAGLLGAVALVAPALVDSPAAGLTAGLTVVLGLALLWNFAGLAGETLRRRSVQAGGVLGAATGALGSGILFGLAGALEEPLMRASLAATFAIAVLLAARWALAERHRVPWRSGAIAAGLAITALVAVAAGDAASGLVYGGFLVSTTVLLVLPRGERSAAQGWEVLLEHPERLFVTTFLGLAAVGAVVLALPLSGASGQAVGLLDAAFTAVSAVCVTGLVVLDTPVDFSLFGQVMIVLLIQLGGLGIMTFSTAALRLLGRRMSLRTEGAVAQLLSPQDRGRIFASAQQIVLVTLIAEGLGALLLALDFIAHGDTVLYAAWRGVFTSISAFCNAGFALQSESLIPYASDPFALHVVALLIIAGSLSPAAIVALPAIARRRGPVSAQAKIGLLMSGLLLVLGFCFILASEWDNGLAGLVTADRVHNAWFQSVTLRTAGFNSIDLTTLRPATVAVMMALMFVGGSPGGTAGGIKTTTLALLWLSLRAILRGGAEVTAFGRRVTDRALLKAGVLTTVGVTAVVVATTAMLLTQDLPSGDALFEVISALATVGLSLGATAQLDEVGKVLILACMFTGRVGALTLLMILSQRRPPSALGYPPEDVDVG